MLSREKNEKLTRIGPGTPAGELLRRYWHPLCAVVELGDKKPKKRVRILGEDLVVFRDEQGQYGCVAERCAHRGCSLYYGFIEGSDIRCAYHGWKYDKEGRCKEMPFEPKGTYTGKLMQTAYPVQKMAGLLFVYMGPQPAPLLPRWGPLVREDGRRSVVRQPMLNCNWLQIEENTLDSLHTYYLHAETLKANGMGEGMFAPAVRFYSRPIAEYGWELCEWGINKRVVYGGDHPGEEIRPPMIFPNILIIDVPDQTVHWRVPVDDTHTEIIIAVFEPSKDGRKVEQFEEPPVTHVREDEVITEDGEYILGPANFLTAFLNQDRMAWETPGPIFDRTTEHLGATDRGIVMFRKLLEDQIDIVQQGGDPLGVLRDLEKNQIIEFESTPPVLEEARAS